MCFIRLRKRFNKLQDTLDNLYSFIKTKEYEKLKSDSIALKEENELLSRIKFEVKDIRVIEDDNTGEKIVRIVYKQPIIMLRINEETKEPLKDDTFYAINRLNLTDISDMERIQKVLRELK